MYAVPSVAIGISGAILCTLGVSPNSYGQGGGLE